MKLHNTLTRRTEVFEPQTTGQVSLYTCGPTVYDFAHIGNLRSFIFDDTLRRTLAAEYDVTHVMNITDVGHLVGDETDSGEDKFEKGAKREGLSVYDVAARYTEAFKRDMAALNVMPPNGYDDKEAGDTYARATRFLDTQIDMVKLLLERGHAYRTDQAVYFDVTSLPTYGRLSGQTLADKEVAVRDEVVTDPDKRHPFDFSVWFFTVGHYADHVMRWPSPWGEGFPGWHLECSAIIHATLGDPIDIHTGGVDHIGTHHANEMAQTEAAFGHELARTWMHNEFILVDGAKMSKSKGNFYTLADLAERGYAPMSYRLLCLQAHYRSELNFTLDSLEAAQNTLLNIYAWADLRHQRGLSVVQLDPSNVSGFLARVKAHMADDLGTPKALAELYRYMLELSPGMRYDDEDSATILRGLDELLGLGLDGRPDAPQEVTSLLAERQQARESKDYAQSDALRAKLRKLGYDVDDTPNGPRWRRTSI